MSTPPETVKVICPRCNTPYKDWLRHINPRLDKVDEAYLEKASSVTCPHCSFKLTSGDMARFEQSGSAAPIIRLKEGIKVEGWEGERWSWQPRQSSQRPRLPEGEDWCWFFSDATLCHRWRWDTEKVPGAAPAGSSTSLIEALDARSGWPREGVYVALGRRWHDTADTDRTQLPLYNVVAVEDVTLVLADFCTGLIQEPCEATGLAHKNHKDLYQQTYLTFGGFLRPEEVAALQRKLHSAPGATEGQKHALSWWNILLDYWDMLTVGTVETLLFYKIPLGDLDEHHVGEEAATPSQRQAEALTRLEGLLLDELGV